LLAVLLVASIGAAQASGLQDLQFGATESEVVASQSNPEKLTAPLNNPTGKMHANYRLTNYKIVGDSFSVVFWMGDESQRLELVFVSNTDSYQRHANATNV
jgi:hypothetical protein